MALTLEDLKDKLKREDEVTLMELLEVSSEDLVEMFEHRIDARYEILIEDYEEELDDE